MNGRKRSKKERDARKKNDKRRKKERQREYIREKKKEGEREKEEIGRGRERERVRKIQSAASGKEAGRRWRWKLPSFVDREIERAAVQR